MKSSSQLFIHCPFLWEVWSGLARDFGVPFIPPLGLSDLQGWCLKAFSILGKRIWKLVPAAVCWAVWRKRNNRVFKDQVELAYQAYRRAKELIPFWARRCKEYSGLPEGALVKDWVHGVGANPYQLVLAGLVLEFCLFCGDFSSPFSLVFFLFSLAIKFFLSLKKKDMKLEYQKITPDWFLGD